MQKQRIQFLLIQISIVGVLLFAFILFGRPRWIHLQNIKAEFLKMQRQIHQVESVLTQGSPLEEQIRFFDHRNKYINNAFPAKEEETLGKLSDMARKYRLQVSTVRIQPVEPFLNSEQNEVMIDGKKCQTIIIAIQMSGSFKDFVDYLEHVKNSLPAYVTVERLDLQKQGTSPPALNILLELKLYLLS